MSEQKNRPPRKTSPLFIASFLLVVLLIALLAKMTQDTEQDPCANFQQDISAAVFADEEDQDALLNRAIIMRAQCEKQ